MKTNAVYAVYAASKIVYINGLSQSPYHCSLVTILQCDTPSSNPLPTFPSYIESDITTMLFSLSLRNKKSKTLIP